MAVLLALCSAAAYGTGDFFGGLAARRVPAAAVVLWSHVLGLGLFLLLAPLGGGSAGGGDLLAGALGGLAGAAGVGLLYRALAAGTMSTVAPVTALLAAAVPVIVGLAAGERPTTAKVVGIALALAAIVLVSADDGPLRLRDVAALRLALGAGLGFGLFFVAFSTVDDGAGLWPLVAARSASVAAFGGLALAGRTSGTLPRGRLGLLTAGAGALDALANLLFLLAVRTGLLSVVAALSALYPVSTVVLARVVLGERLRPVQRAGLALALPAAILIAV